MKALVTGASSGIGYDIAKYLGELGCDLVLIARDKEKMQKLQKELKVNVKIIVADLSNEAKVKDCYVVCKNENIDILVNNAGFGDFGNFDETDLSKDLDMINVNIKAVHIFTKLFLRDMKKRNKGYILNVASSAAFAPGPLMATYYSTKSYVFRLTTSIAEELRKSNSKVHICCLCPGPVKTNFNNVAGVKFSIKPLTSEYVAHYAVDNMFRKKMIIIPGLKIKLSRFFSRFISEKTLSKITYKIQNKKRTVKEIVENKKSN